MAVIHLIGAACRSLLSTQKCHLVLRLSDRGEQLHGKIFEIIQVESRLYSTETSTAITPNYTGICAMSDSYNAHSQDQIHANVYFTP